MPVWLNLSMCGAAIVLTHLTAFYMGKTSVYREMTRLRQQETKELMERFQQALNNPKE